MVYIIHKDIWYQDVLNQRIDIGLYYVEQKDIKDPKDYVLFGTECCKEFVEEDVFFNSVDAYNECFRRNRELVSSIVSSITDSIFTYNKKQRESTTRNSEVTCKDCKYLMFSDCYGECSKGIKGLVNPDDYCGKGVRKKN